MADISEFEFIEYLLSTRLPYREHGDELAFQYCPYCENDGCKSPYQHFYFSRSKMIFMCHKCGEKGNLFKFKLDRGDIKPLSKSGPMRYKRPADNAELTAQAEDHYAWYEKERGISADVLKKYKVGFQQRDGQLIIVYQYYDAKGELINRKYRSADKKMLWTEKEAEKGYYGLQYIDFSKPVLHVVEGEDDCHAMVQIGFNNVVSVPYGAGNYTPAMDLVNKKFSSIILIFDNDEKGQDGARKFAEKAGMSKCKNVILPFKDARDCLLQNMDIFEIGKHVNNAVQFKHENIIKAGDARKELTASIFDSKKIMGHMTPIPEFNEITGGIRMGELSVLIG